MCKNINLIAVNINLNFDTTLRNITKQIIKSPKTNNKSAQMQGCMGRRLLKPMQDLLFVQNDHYIKANLNCNASLPVGSNQDLCLTRQKTKLFQIVNIYQQHC